jgi:flagellar motor switch protein FliM
MPDSLIETPRPSDVLDLVGPFKNMHARIPSMDVFRERFFRLSRTAFFQKFRRNLQIEQEVLEIRIHDEYINSVPTPSYFAIHEFAPLRGFLLFQLSGQLIAAVIDDLYGAGGMKTEFTGKDLSAMEMRIASLLAGVFAKSLAETFYAYIPVQPSLIRTETHTTLATIADSKDQLVVMSASFGTACGSGPFSIAVPYVALEPHKEAFAASVSMASRRDDDDHWRDAMMTRLLEVPLSLSIEIATIRLSLRRLANLKPGDVLPLPMSAHAVVKEKRVHLGKAVIGTTADGVGFQCN